MIDELQQLNQPIVPDKLLDRLLKKFQNKDKKTIAFSAGAVLLILVLIFVISLPAPKSKINIQKNENNLTEKVKAAAYPEFKTAINSSQWPEFSNSKFFYSLKYPPEFKVEDRGRIGKLENLTALTFEKNGKTITVLKIQITNEIPQSSVMVQESGKDLDGNEVLVYKYPYGSKKTLTIIGTVFLSMDDSISFKESITEVASTLKINL